MPAVKVNVKLKPSFVVVVVVDVCQLWSRSERSLKVSGVLVKRECLVGPPVFLSVQQKRGASLRLSYHYRVSLLRFVLFCLFFCLETKEKHTHVK